MAEIKLTAVQKEIAAIDAHLAKYKAKEKASKAVSVGSTVCLNYAKGKPIIDLLAILLGKSAGTIISSVSSGLSAYCGLEAIKNPTAADLKLKSKAIAQICKGYDKFKPIIDLAILLFAKQVEWQKALKGIQATIEGICATPNE